MPTMLRIPGKAKKIAENILGPGLVESKKKKRKSKSKVDQRLTFEETVRVR